MVGNGGDGVLALFEGSDQGLTLTSSAINPDLPSPSDLVYAGLAGGDVQFYAASSGREAAALVALSLGGEIAPITPPPSPTPTVAQLVPLQESSLALVGTFLVTTLPSSAIELSLGPAETEVAPTVSLSTAGPAGLGQGPVAPGPGQGTGPGDEPAAQPEPAAAQPGAEPAAATWQQRVLETDEALERFDREHPDLFQPRREEGSEANPSQGQRTIAPPVPESPPVGQSRRAAARLWQAVDWCLEHPDDEPPNAGRVGATRQKPDDIMIRLVRFTHPTEEQPEAGRMEETRQESQRIPIRLPHTTHRTVDREAGPEQHCDFAAALALAASLASEFYFGTADRRTGFRSRRRSVPCLGIGMDTTFRVGHPDRSGKRHGSWRLARSRISSRSSACIRS